MSPDEFTRFFTHQVLFRLRHITTRVRIKVRVVVELLRCRPLARYIFREFRNRRGYFVELGANDGITQSSTLGLQFLRNWTGCLVEAFPGYIPQIQVARGKACDVFCAAATSTPSDPIKLHYGGLMTRQDSKSDGIAEGISSYVVKAEKYLPLGAKSFQFVSEARPLHSMLEEAGAPRSVDLVVIDVEGAELSVLEGLLNSDFISRDIIIETAAIDSVTEYLGKRGFQLIAKVTHHDFHFRYIE